MTAPDLTALTLEELTVRLGNPTEEERDQDLKLRRYAAEKCCWQGEPITLTQITNRLRVNFVTGMRVLGFDCSHDGCYCSPEWLHPDGRVTCKDHLK